MSQDATGSCTAICPACKGKTTRVPLTVYRTIWQRRLWLGRKWVLGVSLARREDD